MNSSTAMRNGTTISSIVWLPKEVILKETILNSSCELHFSIVFFKITSMGSHTTLEPVLPFLIALLEFSTGIAFSWPLLSEFNEEQNRVSLEIYFRNGKRINGICIYSMRAAYEDFREVFPDAVIHSDHSSRSVKRFLPASPVGSINRK
ncbi:hypothetical protein NQ318_006309 [Aromia moschata]|uniref:Uncharacterized protein n=1 Tax=Aromia moschata TaxID=1265417 RepID=A0AAV8YXW1_9CUCU|nr:hypothetical protein NQ318_006309 [Aromia moschata]